MTIKTAIDVLIVDDQEATGLAELLSTSGYSVKIAVNGDVALRLAQYLKVGVIILNVDVCQTGDLALLESLHSGAPVVILSSSALDDDELGRIGSKVVMQLQKPVEPHHIVRVVAATLGRF